MSEPPRTPWHARRRLWTLVAVLTAMGYVTVAVLAIGKVYHEYHRKPTKGELYRAALLDVRHRWQTWPADRIFPGNVPYTTEQGSVENAQRVGIAPQSGCADGIEAAPAGTLTGGKCQALLRATYVDQPRGLVFTVGIAAFPDEDTAGAAAKRLPSDPHQPALHALGFPGTVTAPFGDAARQFASTSLAGPYVVMTAAGQLDARPAAAVAGQRGSLFSMVPEVASNIGVALARLPLPNCSQRRAWRC